MKLDYIKKYGNINVLVIGDTCIDKFVYGKVVRLAPEAPVPIFNPTYENQNDGMAGNVHRNLLSLQCKSSLISNENQISKTRFVDERSGQIILRVDENDKINPIKETVLKKIVNNNFDGEKFDGIIISDYNKGFLNEKSIKYICENNRNVFIDTKKILDEWCKNATFIKINHVEYDHTKYNLKDLNINEKLIITHSNKGCVYMDKMFPVKKVQVIDVSGAGDTFLSGFVLEYLRTNKIEDSIHFAQECATIVVQKKGVCTIE